MMRPSVAQCIPPIAIGPGGLGSFPAGHKSRSEAVSLVGCRVTLLRGWNGFAVLAWPGGAGHGSAGRGEAWQGKASASPGGFEKGFRLMRKQIAACPGVAGRGDERRVRAWQGRARQGVARQSFQQEA